MRVWCGNGGSGRVKREVGEGVVERGEGVLAR
jgi:hypothetical protein